MDLKRILYIEDNVHNRRLVRRILEPHGYALVEAEDGDVGLRLLRDLKPALVLLDIGLPTVDGFEVLQRIRADEELCHTSVIALTASVLEATRERFLAAGGDDYVTKPIKMHELVEKIGSHHEGHRQVACY